ncbi:MAG: hypothetical protein GVX96_02570 [Bacteroidetes bacterium]|nr:hypothetical protein [Bacteroidota bacterium]
MKKQRVEKQEESKRKGLIATFVFHSVALLLALYPMMNVEEKEPKMQAVVVEFEHSAKSEGAKKVKKKVVAKRETRKAASLPQRASKMLTTDRPQDIKVPEVKRTIKVPDAMPDPLPSKAPIASKSRVPKPVKAPVAVTPSFEPSEAELADAAAEDASEGAIDGTAEGLAENAAESGEGEGEKGEGSSDLGDGSSKGTGFIGGNGILTRKIVKRANINGLVKESGTIVIKLCVTQDGAVDYVEYDPESSSISNPAAVKGALEAMSLYRFERDYSAAQRECGSFQFNIEL